jgi:hypothetical protein
MCTFISWRLGKVAVKSLDLFGSHDGIQSALSVSYLQ